jgi:hypothetical protein
LKFSISSGKRDEKEKQGGAPIINYSRNIPNSEISIDPKNLSVNQQSLGGRLGFYQDKLLQLDRRNRSINLNHIYNKWSFDLGTFNTPLSKKYFAKSLI